ncbi:MAG TPA: hypothetical protein VFE46_07265 [Pirellulales bacterium]|jgi:Amt family ammonium transporter|nr:hypothetical protein [Pirellulales bacterium]
MIRRRNVFSWAGLAMLLVALNSRVALAQEPNSLPIAQPTTNSSFPWFITWALAAGCLTLLVPAGMALVAGGMNRPKNSAHMFAMSLMIVPLAGCAIFLYGFALGWGNLAGGLAPPGWSTALGSELNQLNRGIGFGSEASAPDTSIFGLFGATGFALTGLYTPGVLALFFLMSAFLMVAATIPTGAMAERWAWRSFVLYGFWVIVPLALFANWVWGGGWLAQMGKNWNLGHGAVDFAGSGVIHAMGAIIGLAGTICIGSRLGKFVNRRPRAMPGHNIPYVVVGTLILLFAWFGMTAGATLAGTDLQLSSVFVNTLLGGIGGAVGAMFYLLATVKKPDPTLMCNGLVAGLVSISGACAFVSPWAALVIGVVGGVLIIISVLFWDKVGVDDPVGAVSMHGVAGLWGVISVGLFANGKFGAGWNGVAREVFSKSGADGVRGLFYGDASQLTAQLIEAGVLIVFGFLVAYGCFKLSALITPLRVSRDAELQGLDGSEMGTLAYPDFVLKSGILDA